MKKFSVSEIVHTPPWDLETEFQVAFTPQCSNADLEHFAGTVTRCLKERGALVTPSGNDQWTVKMPIDWEKPEAPVLPPGIEEVQMSLTQYNRLHPWEVPELVHVVQCPEDTRQELGMFVALSFPGTLKVHDAVIIKSSGSSEQGNIKVLMWIRTTKEERDDMKAATELMEKLVDMKDRGMAIAIKASALASLNPQIAERIMAKAKEALDNHEKRN